MKPRQVILLIGVLALLVIILLSRHQFVQFWHLLVNIRLYVLLAVVAVQLLSYFLNALYYRSILRAFNYRVGLPRLFEGALAANFVNYVFPTAGLGGAAFMSQVLKPDVPRGKGFLIQIIRYVLSSAATALFIPVAILLLLASGRSDTGVFEIVILASLIILVIAVALYRLVRNEKRVRRLLEWLGVKFKFFQNVSAKEFADDFYRGFHAIFGDLKAMAGPFGWSVAYIVVEVATLYLAFVALGKTVNPGIVLMGYIAANIASFFGGVVISVGAFEISLTGVLFALGQPFAFALSVALVYRVINMLIGLPPGFIYYRKYLR